MSDEVTPELQKQRNILLHYWGSWIDFTSSEGFLLHALILRRRAR